MITSSEEIIDYAMKNAGEQKLMNLESMDEVTFEKEKERTLKFAAIHTSIMQLLNLKSLFDSRIDEVIKLMPQIEEYYKADMSGDCKWIMGG